MEVLNSDGEIPESLLPKESPEQEEYRLKSVEDPPVPPEVREEESVIVTHT